MIITHLNNGDKASFRLSGKTIAIGGQVSIDLEERQRDTQNVIDVCLDNQLRTMREGMGAWYVATILVPPKQQELVADGQDEDGNEQYKLVDRPLDISRVELRLWALPEGYNERPTSGPELEAAGTEAAGEVGSTGTEGGVE